MIGLGAAALHRSHTSHATTAISSTPHHALSAAFRTPARYATRSHGSATGGAAWLLWELWSAVAPKPITDDFLKLLDDSFGRRWRDPRTWPWTRLGWAYGFTALGATVALFVVLLFSSVVSSSRFAAKRTPRVETSQHFRLIR